MERARATWRWQVQEGTGKPPKEPPELLVGNRASASSNKSRFLSPHSTTHPFPVLRSSLSIDAAQLPSCTAVTMAGTWPWGHGSFTPQGTQPRRFYGGHVPQKVLLCLPTCCSAEGTWGFLGGRRCSGCSKASRSEATAAVALPKTSPRAGPQPRCSSRPPREKQRTMLAGAISLLQPSPPQWTVWSGWGVTQAAKCDGSSAARTNIKLASALISTVLNELGGSLGLQQGDK